MSDNEKNRRSMLDHPLRGETTRERISDYSSQTSANFTRLKERDGPLAVGSKLAYAAGEMPGAYMNLAIGAFLLIYYNVVLGASAATVSLALGLALIIDAVSDPLVGAYSDAFKSRLGRRHPFMYAASLPMGLFICLLFTPPGDLEGMMLIVWLLVFLILTRISFTFFSVPWSALIAEFSDSYEERTVIASYRTLVGPLIGGISSFLIFTFVFTGTAEFPKGNENAENYVFFGPLIGSLMTAWALFSTHFTRGEIPYMYQMDGSLPTSLRSTVLSVFLALKSRNYRIVLIAILIFFGVQGTLFQFDIYIATYFWDLTTDGIGLLPLFSIPAPIIGFALARPLQRRFQKQHILCFTMLAQMIFSGLVVCCRLLDIFPSNESVIFMPSLGLFAFAQSLLGIIGGFIVFSMTADLADEQEYETGARQEGVLASGIAFSTKAVGSLGVIVAGFLLEYFIQFPAGQPGAEIAEDVLFRLAITDAIIVNCLLLIPAFIITRYRLTSEAMASMQEELRVRKQAVPD